MTYTQQVCTLSEFEAVSATQVLAGYTLFAVFANPAQDNQQDPSLITVWTK